MVLPDNQVNGEVATRGETRKLRTTLKLLGKSGLDQTGLGHFRGLLPFLPCLATFWGSMASPWTGMEEDSSIKKEEKLPLLTKENWADIVKEKCNSTQCCRIPDRFPILYSVEYL